jgi:hypothetical protein
MIPMEQPPADSPPTQPLFPHSNNLSPDSPSLNGISDTPPIVSEDDDIPELAPRPEIPPLSYRSPSQLSSDWQKTFQQNLRPSAATLNSAVFPIHATQPTIHQPQNEPCGSSFSKYYDGLRIWWNNANNLVHPDDYAELHELCLMLTEYNVGIIALQEVNLNLNRPTIRPAIDDVFNPHFGSCNLVLYTSPSHSPTAWKPGGTLLVVLGTWSHAVAATGQDELGRW